MNEITRIHLAKVAYDVDIAAKKHLEHYIKELEEYTGGGEVLMDVEIRMTELLAERHVCAGGVIANDDVDALRTQLGEPYEFAEEDGDIAVGPINEQVHPRRFFRDTHGAVLGGVLSGIALYVKVDALWIRLAFIVLLFLSFGTAFFGYLLLWVIVPPAVSAADRLRQEGKPVTVASIRKLNSHPADLEPSRVAPLMTRILSVLCGVTFLVGLVGVLAILVVALFGIRPGFVSGMFESFRGSSQAWAWAPMGVAVIVGLLLLAALLGLIAYTFFARRLTKRLVITGVVMIVLGIASCAAFFGIATTSSWQMHDEAQRLLKQTTTSLPASFASIDTIVIESANMSNGGYSPAGTDPAIHYVVAASAPHYELVALPGAKVHTAIANKTATISVSLPESNQNAFVQSAITIYGPSLGALTARGTNVDYSGSHDQAALSVTADNGADVSVVGTIGAVIVSGDSVVDLSSSSVTSLTVDAKDGVEVTAGTIHSLDVTMPDVCPSSSEGQTNVTVSGVTDGSVTYNGAKRDAVSYQTNCATLIIGNDDNSF